MSDFPKHKSPGGTAWGKPQTAHGNNAGSDGSFNSRPRDAKPGDKYKPSGANGEKPQNATFTDDLIALDLELMKVLVRRSKLLSKAKGKLKGQAFINLEKGLRKAFEANSASFSRDPRFSRQFFNMLQEVEIIESKTDMRKPFVLAPSRRPVDIKIPAPACRTMASLCITLATARGLECTIERMPASDHTTDLVKALNLAGARLFWGEFGRISNRQGSTLSFAEKNLYVGDDLFNFHLLLFLSTLQTGRCRLTGGSRLRMTMLRPLRNFLPQLGARLAHQVPGSNSLPVYVESSGITNNEIEITEDIFSTLEKEEKLQFAFCFASTLVTAMFLADKHITINFEALSGDCLDGFEKGLSLCQSIFDKCGAKVEVGAKKITIPSGQPQIRTDFTLSGSAYQSGFLLALPLIHGGNTELDGPVWPRTKYGDEALAFLKAAGLDIKLENGKTSSQRSTQAEKLPPISSLHSHFRPMGLAIAAVLSLKSARPIPVQLKGLSEEFMTLAAEFLSMLGMELNDGAICFIPRDENTPTVHPPAWASPDPVWTLALTFASLQKSGLSLLNPGDMTAVWPAFWTIFNGLPNPDLTPKSKVDNNEPTRRRLIAE